MKIGVLHLTICAQVGDHGLVHPDAIVITEIQELLLSELSVVVDDDGVWDPKIENNVLEKIYFLLAADLR
jgi:hypothetical protein